MQKIIFKQTQNIKDDIPNVMMVCWDEIAMLVFVINWLAERYLQGVLMRSNSIPKYATYILFSNSNC